MQQRAIDDATTPLTNPLKVSGSALMPPTTLAAPSPDEAAEGLEAIERVSLRLPMPDTPEVPLDSLTGLPVFEQFLLVWGTPERGAALWEMWLAGRDAAGRGLLEQLAQTTAESYDISLEEARQRLAVEKVLSDVGPQYAVKFLESYKAFAFTYCPSL